MGSPQNVFLAFISRRAYIFSTPRATTPTLLSLCPHYRPLSHPHPNFSRRGALEITCDVAGNVSRVPERLSGSRAFWCEFSFVFLWVFYQSRLMLGYSRTTSCFVSAFLIYLIQPGGGNAPYRLYKVALQSHPGVRITGTLPYLRPA